MKFQLAYNMERNDSTMRTEDVMRHSLEIVQMAERGGFHIVWAAEHHGLEMNIAPNPFLTLTWWANHTNVIRLGTAVAVAAYWNPINLAGEAAFLDVISNGRLEFGLGSGAYQREFDRMHPGLKQQDAYRHMQEMLPAVRALWEGDYEHKGEFWSFPATTSVPKPLQKPHPPVWIAARSPITFDYAVANGCNILCWPMSRPIEEARLYKTQLEESMAKTPGGTRPIFAMMRHAALYDTPSGRDSAVRALQRHMGLFENLFRNLDDVINGFPKRIPLEDLVEREQYDPHMLEENLMFGSPDQIIAKLKRMEELGVDEFIYLSSMGLSQSEQKKSLELFCNEVIPAFR
ncbi:MAG: LLM class flavin-dependent oxidoreductase [Gammaproteobacteria bacterium]|nr:LLM class flavin-dependent oxidoreductase [Gammaproteobacteria bacterium]